MLENVVYARAHNSEQQMELLKQVREYNSGTARGYHSWVQVVVQIYVVKCGRVPATIRTRAQRCTHRVFASNCRGS